jgi:hypothetical protein
MQATDTNDESREADVAAAVTASSNTPQSVSFDPTALDHIIEEWYREQINNSVVSRITECVNHVRASVDDLKKRLGIGGTKLHATN